MYIVTLKNAREVIKADQACKNNTLQASIIPTPTDISSECGMALRVESADMKQLTALLQSLNLTPRIYER